VLSEGDTADPIVQQALVASVTGLQTREAMKLVVPSSVAVASGSATVAANGFVTFTGASRVSLNGVFDGLHDDVYEIYASWSSSAANNVSTRTRNAGVDRATASYNYVATSTVFASGPGRSAQFGATSMGFWSPGVGFASLVRGRMTMYSPGREGPTMSRLSSNIAASDRFMWEEYGEINGAHDGFSLIVSSGTITGTIRVVKVA
jgi:hypothetical protein